MTDHTIAYLGRERLAGSKHIIYIGLAAGAAMALSLLTVYILDEKANVAPNPAGGPSNSSALPENVGQPSTVNSSQVTGLQAENFTTVVGNTIDVGLSTANSGVVFQDASTQASIRFTSKYSGDAVALVIKVLTTNTHIFKVGLQDDDGSGLPAGTWLGFGTGSSQGEKFLKISLQKPVHVTQGKVYHIVSALADSPSGGDASIMTYAAKSSFQPYNDADPDLPWPDPRMDTLSFDGKRWNEENKWPTFVVQYADGREQGQPYTLYAPWIVQSRVYVGEVFVPTNDYVVGRIGFVVDAIGKSQDRLYFEILDSRNHTLSQGVLGNSSQIGVMTKKWMDATLDSPVALKKGEFYRIILFSPGTGAKEAYEVYGHEFTYDPKIGYGGTLDQLTISDNAGSTWQPWEDADTIFRLFTAKSN